MWGYPDLGVVCIVVRAEAMPMDPVINKILCSCRLPSLSVVQISISASSKLDSALFNICFLNPKALVIFLKNGKTREICLEWYQITFDFIAVSASLIFQ